jgi:hypothetical protein
MEEEEEEEGRRWRQDKTRQGKGQCKRTKKRFQNKCIFFLKKDRGPTAFNRKTEKCFNCLANISVRMRNWIPVSLQRRMVCGRRGALLRYRVGV